MRTQSRLGNLWRASGPLALVAILALAAPAQEPTAPESAGTEQPKADVSPEPVKKRAASDDALPGEEQPSMLYLPDENGKLRPVPGFDLKELIELYKVKNRIEEQNRPPAYSISEVRFDGTADKSRADLAGEFKIAIHAAGWVRVPLRLADSMLAEPAEFDGPGDHVIKVAPDEGGYEVWIRGGPDTIHRVKLRLWTPVEQIGAESRLHLNVVRAPLAQLDLRVPLARAVARVSDGSTLVAAKPAGDKSTQLSAIGLSGEFALTWQAADTPVARLPTVLDATGAITLRVDGRTINSEAKLTVRSSGGEFDSFRVRLPPGAELTPAAPGPISIVATESDDPLGKICEVKLAGKTSEPVDVRLVAQRTVAPQADDAPLELAGFEVLDAVRQSGAITVQVAGDWQIQWGEMRHVRQTDDFFGIFAGDDPAAVFEYSAQPFSLTARVKALETRRRVEANYVVLVGGNEAELRARLKYTIRGAKVRTLEVDAPGWNVDLIGPGNLVNVDAVIAGQNNPLVIPLLQAASGEVEVTFAARQQIAADTGKLSLRLPAPRGESVAAANVTIVPADNVEFQFEPERSRDLAPQTVRPAMPDLPERQQEPLHLRTAGDAPEIAASFKVHSQEISAAIAGKIEVDERSAQVDEQIAYHIAYEPTDHVELAIPRGLRLDQLEITLDGQRLTPAAMRDRADTASAAIARVNLPQPRIGRCELALKYSVPLGKLADDASTVVDVPLVIPAEGKLTANQLTVMAQPAISLTYPQGPWSVDTSPTRAANASALRLSATRAIASVGLAVSVKQRQVDHTTTVHQAWIETRLTGSRRQDRAAFRLTTSEPSVRMILPPGVEPASLEIELDGGRYSQAVDLASDGRTFTLALPSATSSQHLLELRYTFQGRPGRGQLSLLAPQIESGKWIRQLYWQLELPANEHVFGAPASYAREYRWTWSNLFWRREPSLDDRELQSWIGLNPTTIPFAADDFTTNGAAPAADGDENEYLFSTAGGADPLEVHTISRTRLVLLGSLPLLVAGLSLIYFPALRHPAALFAAAVALAALATIDPDSAILVAQAATLGLLLALIAFAWSRIAIRPAAPATPMRGSSQSLDRSYTESFQRPIASGSQPSTATNPLVPSSAPEGQP